MTQTLEYTVPGMSCAHCTTAVTQAAEGVPGVASVEVNLDTKVVVVHGESLDDAAIRGAIDEAGYEAA
jgi:copper chaperone CopZ